MTQHDSKRDSNLEMCPDCGGTGDAPVDWQSDEAASELCPTCNGNGTIGKREAIALRRNEALAATVEINNEH